jgi:predicted transcriptional regulator
MEDPMGLKIVERGLMSPSETYDVETGEVQEGALVWVPRRDKSQFGRDWFQMAQDTLRIINSHRKELGLEGMVVFNALMARLDFENFIQVSQSEVATELEMKPSNVSRAIKKLLDHGFIKAGPKVGKSYTYQLHPELGWKGKAKAHHTAREQARSRGWNIIRGGAQGTIESHDEDQAELPFPI